MNPLPAALAAHLEQEVTSLCHCWRLTRTDGGVTRHTDHDRALSVGGEVFAPLTGFTGSEVRDTLGLSIDIAEVEGALSAGEITEADLFAGRYDGATVETFLVNWRDPAQFALLRKAIVGAVKRLDGRFVAELQSPARSLDQRRGRVIRRRCDAQLGDARCGVSLAGGFSGAGAVTGEAVNGALPVSGLGGFSSGWFAEGELTWTTGANTGLKQRVIDSRRSGPDVALVLWSDSPPPISIGDEFTITAGCDKRFATCKAKFANQLNFRGFPHVPGNDRAYGYATDGAVFDGGPVVP